MATTLKVLSLVVLCSVLSVAIAFAQPRAAKNRSRERARDGIVRIEKELVLDIPQVPRLCDQMSIVKCRVNVGDCNLYCEIEGNGVPLVLLHGGPGATHHYFHPSFSRAKDFAKLIYYDQRGCGLSDYKKGKGYSIEQAVEDLENLRRSLKIDTWVVLGNSYGGLLAQCYAVKYPERVSGLILVTSAVAMPTDGSTRQYEFISEQERKKIGAVHSNGNLSSEQSLYNAWLNGDWKRQTYYKPSRERIAQIARYEWKHDTNFNSIMGQDMGRVDLKGAFNSCPIPTMIMEGRWDLTWNTDKPGILHKNHPNGRPIFFEESAHTPFDDEPEKSFDTLRDYVLNLPEVPREKLEQWKKYLFKWRKEKEREEKAKKAFLVGEMSEGEAQAIKEFRKIREKILTGKKYENTSTPLRTVLTFLSALHLRDVKAYKRIYALDLDKMAEKPVSESIAHMAEAEQYLMQFDILRAPLPAAQPEEGTFGPIYVKYPNGTEVADTLMPVFWKGKWMWFGNVGAPVDWRGCKPRAEALLEQFGK